MTEELHERYRAVARACSWQRGGCNDTRLWTCLLYVLFYDHIYGMTVLNLLRIISTNDESAMELYHAIPRNHQAKYSVTEVLERNFTSGADLGWG